MKKTILIIAPHCDDEILGCGATMAKLISQGNKVFVAIMTNGYLGAPELFTKEGTEKVRSEALSSHKLLGVQKTYFLDFPAPKLDTLPLYKIAGKLNEIIKNVKATTIYIPHHGDIHKDHLITHQASMVASRPINNCPVRNIYSYETLSETEWASPSAVNAFLPNVFEDVSDFIKQKVEAFRLYETQIKEYPHPRSVESIINLSKFRGSTIGANNAEAFNLIREIK